MSATLVELLQQALQAARQVDSQRLSELVKQIDAWLLAQTPAALTEQQRQQAKQLAIQLRDGCMAMQSQLQKVWQTYLADRMLHLGYQKSGNTYPAGGAHWLLSQRA